MANASRQLNKAEVPYSALEVEALAVVWVTKYFRYYLYCIKFLIITHHVALKFLIITHHVALNFLHRFVDNKSRLMRWSLSLSEFAFDIEHIPGTELGHMNALSQHVAVVSEKTLLTNDRFYREQMKDAFCNVQRRKHFVVNSEFFIDEVGVIYRRQKDKNDQIVVPESLVIEIIQVNQDPVVTVHPGRKRTYELIALKYWWPKMRQMVEEYISCQRRTAGPQFHAPLGELPEPPELLQVTSMDITVPYNLTPHKNKYLLTFIYHCTRYPQAFPIPNISTEICLRVYTFKIVSSHGTGSDLITDQCKQLQHFSLKLANFLIYRSYRLAVPSSNQWHG